MTLTATKPFFSLTIAFSLEIDFQCSFGGVFLCCNRKFREQFQG